MSSSFWRLCSFFSVVFILRSFSQSTKWVDQICFLMASKSDCVALLSQAKNLLDLAFTLPWPCPNLALTFFWPCLDLPWHCPNLSFTLPWIINVLNENIWRAEKQLFLAKKGNFYHISYRMIMRINWKGIRLKWSMELTQVRESMIQHHFAALS